MKKMGKKLGYQVTQAGDIKTKGHTALGGRQKSGSGEPLERGPSKAPTKKKNTGNTKNSVPAALSLEGKTMST